MADKKNCWEFKKCGRDPNDKDLFHLDHCPAAIAYSCNGLNSGKNGGRICWVVGGTYCDGKVQGSYAQKLRSCLTCDFYKMVSKEEGHNFRFDLPVVVNGE